MKTFIQNSLRSLLLSLACFIADLPYSAENISPNWHYLSTEFKTENSEWLNDPSELKSKIDNDPSLGVCFTQYTQYMSLISVESPETNPQRLELGIKLLSNVDLETADPKIYRNKTPVLLMRGQVELRPLYDDKSALLVPVAYRSLVPYVLSKSTGAEDLFNVTLSNVLAPEIDKSAGLNVSDALEKKSFMQMGYLAKTEDDKRALLVRIGRSYFTAGLDQYLKQSMDLDPLQNEVVCLFEEE